MKFGVGCFSIVFNESRVGSFAIRTCSCPSREVTSRSRCMVADDSRVLVFVVIKNRRGSSLTVSVSLLECSCSSVFHTVDMDFFFSN